MSLTNSDEELLLLHNPGCSKSRGLKAILEERGVAFRERNYLEDPLSRSELDDLRERLDLSPTAWIRGGEAEFRNAGLAEEGEEGALLEAMVVHPILMQRPILVRGNRALVGRPPEAALDVI